MSYFRNPFGQLKADQFVGLKFFHAYTHSNGTQSDTIRQTAAALAMEENVTLTHILPNTYRPIIKLYINAVVQNLKCVCRCVGSLTSLNRPIVCACVSHILSYWNWMKCLTRLRNKWNGTGTTVNDDSALLDSLCTYTVSRQSTLHRQATV